MAYYVYILASRKDGAIYIGVTNDLVRRIYEHRIKAVPGFTSKYNITGLVWFEIYEDPVSAISREKELKQWKRNWKVRLIEAQNPDWKGCTALSVSESVISEQCEAPNPDSRDSGFASPTRLGMTGAVTPWQREAAGPPPRGLRR
jgi:putative endonuclease